VEKQYLLLDQLVWAKGWGQLPGTLLWSRGGKLQSSRD